jgi:hypothetical protein
MQNPAGLGEGDPPGSTLKQWQPQPVFQFSDSLTHCCGAYSQHASRFRETSMLSNKQEGS